MFRWLFRSLSPKPPTEIVFDGDGDFDFDIVGESHYQAELESIAGRKSEASKEYYCKARLVCELDNPYDENAVAIRIAGCVVGHLSREDAFDYREDLRRRYSPLPVLIVDAVIVGGWKSDHSEGHFGVKLDFYL